MKILAIGTSLIDTTFETKEGILIDNKKDLTRQKLVGFELGAKIEPKKIYKTFGGGALNVATNFALQNCQTNILSALGNDNFGKEILENLKTKKISIELIQYSNNSTAYSFIIKYTSQENKHTIFINRGASLDLKIDLDKLPKITNDLDLIYLNSLSGKNSLINIHKIFSYKKKFKNLKIAWNPGGEQIKLGLNKFSAVLLQTDYLMLNKDEAIEFLGAETTNPCALIKNLKMHCSGIILLTDGEKGAYAMQNNKIYFEKGIKTKALDTTGVGDAYNSTFVYCQLKGLAIEKSLELASYQASSVLKQVGAQNGLIKLKNKS